MTSKTEKPKFKMGQRVKIVRGAPATYMTILDDVGKKGRITDILISGENDIGWHDETLGKYAYRVLPDDRDDPALALYYPESSLI